MLALRRPTTRVKIVTRSRAEATPWTRSRVRRSSPRQAPPAFSSSAGRYGGLRRAGRWPHAQGTVTRSWTETVTREINPTDSTGPTTSRINVRVNYRYVVGGTAHSGDRVTFFPSTMSHGFAQLAREHCDRYAAGTALDVRYDPRNPSDAVIETAHPEAVLSRRRPGGGLPDGWPRGPDLASRLVATPSHPCSAFRKGRPRRHACQATRLRESTPRSQVTIWFRRDSGLYAIISREAPFSLLPRARHSSVVAARAARDLSRARRHGRHGL